MSENHNRFIEHLKKSEEARWFVAWWLSKKKKIVCLPPMEIAPSHDKWQPYADKGDIYVLSDSKDKWLRNETKELRVCFSCANDWPYGNDFIVCAKHSYDNAIIKPVYYFILSNDWKNIALVNTKNVANWIAKERVDSRYEGEEARQNFYFSPICDISWMSTELQDR